MPEATAVERSPQAPLTGPKVHGTTVLRRLAAADAVTDPSQTPGHVVCRIGDAACNVGLEGPPGVVLDLLTRAAASVRAATVDQ